MAGKKILVIDDDSDILEAVRITLEDEGYKVETAKNANKLFKTIESLPDLIILDILLSGIDGREISRQLRSNKATSKIPIILVSADSASKKNFSRSMASDFISKPFSIDDFIKTIRKHLR